MSCATCEKRIERALLQVQGVSRVRAHASLSRVEVSFDRARVSERLIAEAIRAAGYVTQDTPAPVGARRFLPAAGLLGLTALVACLFFVMRPGLAPHAEASRRTTGVALPVLPSAGSALAARISAAGAALTCAVPSNEMGVAERVGAWQTVEVKVLPDGYHPALVVIQKGVPARIRFIPASPDACTSVVEFPGYPARLDLATQQTVATFPEVIADFTFRCGRGLLHGYVKVVDDTGAFDRTAVRRQVDAYRPGDTGAAACCGY
jgi:copper chaperone CopZ